MIRTVVLTLVAIALSCGVARSCEHHAPGADGRLSMREARSATAADGQRSIDRGEFTAQAIERCRRVSSVRVRCRVSHYDTRDVATLGLVWRSTYVLVATLHAGDVDVREAVQPDPAPAQKEDSR
jgi:hypothetical protein